MILGITSPASQNTKEELKNGVEYLKEKGIKVVIGKSCYRYLSTKERAEELYELDDLCDAILCSRGGCGSFNLLEYLDRPFRKNIIGYSDITALLLFQLKHDAKAIHGPMLLDYKKSGSLDNLIDVLENGIKKGQTFESRMNSICLIKGNAEGKAVPVNLSLLMTVKDNITHEKIFRDSILIIEDVEESVCSIERYLWQLTSIKEFNMVRGVIFGGFTKTQESSNPYGLMDVLKNFASRLNKPCFLGFPTYHGKFYKTSIPVGMRIHMDSENGIVKSIDSFEKISGS